MINIKNKKELEIMREAGKRLAFAMEDISSKLTVGMSTLELDEISEKSIISAGGRPAFKGLYGFPGSACISLNEEVVHGVPKKNKIIKSGDLVSIDIGIEYKGFYSDMAKTFAMGNISPAAKKLMEVTESSLSQAIEKMGPNICLGDIGHIIEGVAKANNLYILENYGGHGIGKKPHEDPHVPNRGTPNTGVRLKPGMVLAIEPMFIIGTGESFVDEADKWTVIAKNKGLSAHFEHTIAIIDGGCEVFTRAS